MRFALGVFSAFGVILSCITSSFGHPSPQMMNVNISVGHHVSRNDSNSNTTTHLPRAKETASPEERLFLNSPMKVKPLIETTGLNLANGWMRAGIDDEVVLNYYQPLTSSKDPYELASDLLKALDRSDLVALVMYFSKKGGTNTPGGALFVEALSAKHGDAAVADALYEMKRSGQDFWADMATEMLDHQMNGWLRSRLSPGGVFLRLKIWSGKGSVDLRLTMLQAYINRFNDITGKRWTLYDTLVKVSNHVSGKMKKVSAEVAAKMQMQIVQSLIKRSRAVKDALSSLKLRPVQLFKHESRKVVNEIVEELGHVKEEKIDLNSVSREHFGDGEFAEGIMLAVKGPKTDTKAAQESKEWLIKQWGEEDHPSDREHLLNKLTTGRGAVSQERASAIADSFSLLKFALVVNVLVHSGRCLPLGFSSTHEYTFCHDSTCA
uniref:RxLR effector candidate protein n=1 Tax=Peronospora matthiolae TaxID=2874970 RepID=A0AAV1U6Y5_9STRA